jgi:hypothetical protein
MTKQSDYTIGRKLKIRYEIEELEHLSYYPIVAEQDQDIIKDLLNLMEELNITNWSIEFSNPFVIEKKYAYNRFFVNMDLRRKITQIIEKEKAFKLTK